MARKETKQQFLLFGALLLFVLGIVRMAQSLQPEFQDLTQQLH